MIPYPLGNKPGDAVALSPEARPGTANRCGVVVAAYVIIS
jgi:hypothetical protein